MQRDHARRVFAPNIKQGQVNVQAKILAKRKGYGPRNSRFRPSVSHVHHRIRVGT